MKNNNKNTENKIEENENEFSSSSSSNSSSNDDEKERKKLKIISGGQTGADQAGLRAAQYLHFETGGWAPPGFMTSCGPQPKLKQEFGLKEISENGCKNVAALYVRRSMMNVDYADATIVFRLRPSIGTDKTIIYCKTGKWEKKINEKNIFFIRQQQSYYRPCLVIQDLSPEALETNIASIVNFLNYYRVKTVNIAGHRDDDTAGMKNFEEAVYTTLVVAFQSFLHCNCN